MARCLLALGSNLGDRTAVLAAVCRALARFPASQLLARSRWHPTSPIGGPSGQGEFLNGAVVLQTQLPPQQLAAACHALESQLGRARGVRWDARVIDIDLLLYDEMQIDSPSLTVPHPRMSVRRFVLEPAVEVAGSWRHPSAGWTVAQLLAHLQRSPRYVEVRAAEYGVAAWLAGALRQLPLSPRGGDPQPRISQRRISQPPRAVESHTELAIHPNPVIYVASPPPTMGGEWHQPAVCPALVIALEPQSPAALISTPWRPKRDSREKKTKKYFSPFPENFVLLDIGSAGNNSVRST